MLINLSEKYGFHDNAPTDMPVTAMKYVTIDKSDSTYWYFPEKMNFLLSWNDLCKLCMKQFQKLTH